MLGRVIYATDEVRTAM